MKKHPNRVAIDKAAEDLAAYALTQAPFRTARRSSLKRQFQNMLVTALVADKKKIRDFLVTWKVILQRQVDQVTREHHSKVIQKWDDSQTKMGQG